MLNRLYEWHDFVVLSDVNGQPCYTQQYYWDGRDENDRYEWVIRITRFVLNKERGDFIRVLGGDGVFYYTHMSIRKA